MALDKQIHVYSVDTGHFYNQKELSLHNQNHDLREEKNYIKNGILKELTEKLLKLGYTKSELRKYTLIKSKKEVQNIYQLKNIKIEESLENEYLYWKTIYDYKRYKSMLHKENLLQLLKDRIEKNEELIERYGKLSEDRLRSLHQDRIKDNNVVSLFESSLSRIIGAKTNELCEDLIILQIYYFDIFKDMCYYDMTFGTDEFGKPVKYRYFTSSAGQIRTKKAVFIKESTWLKHEKTLMCGLTLPVINQKGGNNVNKHLAYLALTNSATDKWDDFDIDKTIVVDDFETSVPGVFDYIDDETYTIERITSDGMIPHMDGCGLVLPSTLSTNAMFRAPWIKGLLACFDYVSLIKEKGWSSKIVDIYGEEHDVIEDDIQIIFTKSQFKLYRFYSSWNDYKESFKKYKCEAGLCNIEEPYVKNAKINYQMLQTLTDITDEEIRKIAQSSINKIDSLCDSVENMKDALGITLYNKNPTPFQKAVKIYPSLLNDTYAKDVIRDIKNSLVKKYRSGKLEIYGKYTFILPDLYAVCEYYFGHIKEPQGLLQDKEVFCWLFRDSDKLDCLRSPHLYKEHAVRYNIAYKAYGERQAEIRKWFTTNALYTSTHDLISRILQFDVDGDNSLVIGDKTFVEIAERNMNGIVPLYYNMKKAASVELNKKNIYHGLITAFTGGNIGFFSNTISKIWNSYIFVNGSYEERQEAIDVVKLLCMENNFVIDYAKTLYKPTRPPEIDEKITKYTKINKLPHFFKYAKDKNDDQVSRRNDSVVNKLSLIIPDKRIDTRKLHLPKIDYEKMMYNINTEVDEKVAELYIKLNRIYRYKFNWNNENHVDNLKYVVKTIREEFDKTGYSEIEITDMLVKFLYGDGTKRYKHLFWFVFGNQIVENLKRNIRIKNVKIKICVDCGEPFEASKRKIRCDKCQKIHRLNQYKNQYYNNIE